MIIMGCTKPHDDYDYRALYTGEFTFTTIQKDYDMCYDSSSNCIDGWSILCDTSFYTSNVGIIDSNKLEVQFGEKIFYIKNPNHYDSDTLYQTFNLIVYPNGNLDFPDYEDFNLRYFNGYYIGYDTIFMDMRFGLGGIGSYTKYEITGIRAN